MSDAPRDERELFAGSLHGFVPRRKALSSALRKAGDAARAKRVSNLRKPSVAVWALNRLAVTSPDEVEAVLDAVQRQRDLQIGALRGSLDPVALEEARGDERRGLRSLLDRAPLLLEDDGHAASKTTLDRIATILRRVALDPERREALVAGCLPDEGDEPGGFEAVAAELDPALLLAALQGRQEPPKKKRRSGDSFLARTARAVSRTTSKAAVPATDPAPRASREAADEVARQQRAAARARERRRLEDKVAALEGELEARGLQLDEAQVEREALEAKLAAARKLVVRLKRRQADGRSRLEALRRQLVELDDD